MQAGGWQETGLAGRPAAMAALGLALVLFLAAAWDGVQRLRALEGPGGGGAGAGPAAPPAGPAYRVEEVIAAHLFGRAQAERPRTAAPAAETRLNLTLLGVVAGKDPRLGRAVIQVEGKEARTYRLGDRIGATGAVLHAVEAKRVLLERNGVLESLALKEPKLAGGAAGPQGAAGTPAGNRAVPGTGIAPGARGGSAAGGGGGGE